MAKPDLHQQVTLSSGERRLVTFIPAASAIVGRKITLPDSEEPSRVWVIEEAYGKPVAGDTLPDPHADIRGHRRNTGDSDSRG